MDRSEIVRAINKASIVANYLWLQDQVASKVEYPDVKTYEADKSPLTQQAEEVVTFLSGVLRNYDIVTSPTISTTVTYR